MVGHYAVRLYWLRYYWKFYELPRTNAKNSIWFINN